VIFAFTYVLISLRRIPFLNLDRPSAALLGAVLMVVTGVMSLADAYAAINLDTIALLLGMMVLIAYLREAHFFEFVSAWIVKRSGTPRRMLVLLVVSSGLLSALFVNDTICLLFTPILLAAVREAGLPPVPYLLALCTASNVGSAATLTGNPQNMLVAIFSGLPFGRFALVQLPIALVCLALDAALLLWLHRRDLPPAFAPVAVAPRRANRVVVMRVLGVLVVMLLGFVLPLERWLPGVTSGQKLPLVALVAAVLTLLVARRAPAKLFAHVDFRLLLFFAGLFVVVGGVARVGLLERFHLALAPWFDGSLPQQTASFSLFTLVGSNLVSNVPFVLLAKEWTAGFASPALAWHLLATASTFAGNLTIVGSVANVIVLEQSRDVAPIGFRAYFRVGLPVTLVTTTVAVAALTMLAAWTGVF
jgi:Na+/H+ antiporter NhaD/arsenite permease-like protein